MLIKAYGLFWRADQVNWNPGRGHRGEFKLLGRRGKNRPGLRVTDFRKQSGLYILYGNYGPHYVGLTRTNRMGGRLKDHLSDSHAGEWDRFSWFGFRDVLIGRDTYGLCPLRLLSTVSLGNLHDEIGDMEALLIRGLGLTTNLNKMKFRTALLWKQVEDHEIHEYLNRVAPT